jgi:hypothetical protein
LRQPVEGPDSDLAMFCERLLKVIDNPAAHWAIFNCSISFYTGEGLSGNGDRQYRANSNAAA